MRQDLPPLIRTRRQHEKSLAALLNALRPFAEQSVVKAMSREDRETVRTDFALLANPGQLLPEAD
jgi:hypothetical protein